MLDYSWESKSPSVSSTLTRAAQGREVEAFLAFASVSVSLGDLVLLDMVKDFLGSTLTNLYLIEFLDLTLINFYSCICVCICHMSAGTYRARTGCQIPSCKEVLSLRTWVLGTKLWSSLKEQYVLLTTESFSNPEVAWDIIKFQDTSI